jgi:hypothetical protein
MLRILRLYRLCPAAFVGRFVGIHNVELSVISFSPFSPLHCFRQQILAMFAMCCEELSSFSAAATRLPLLNTQLLCVIMG